MAFGATLSAEADPSTARKSRGAFFTPPKMADILCSWAIKTSSDTVLDPACGEAEFLISSAKRLRELGTSEDLLSNSIYGYELHRESADAASRRCARHSAFPDIRVGDFLKAQPELQVDAVVGNPPYVRFQSIDAKQQEAIQQISADSHVNISSLASYWVPFVVHATSFLKRGGRLAFVLPAELMTVNYASSVRAFLLESFSDITLATFDERVFPEVQEEVVLLFASGYHCGHSDHVLLRSSKNMGDFSTPKLELFYPKKRDERWSAGFIAESSGNLLAALESTVFCRLGDWGRIRLGAVTGNNSFFTLSENQKADFGLADQELLPISPSGSRHLRTLKFSDADFAALQQKEKKVWLFYPEGEPSKAAQDYLAHGVEEGVPKGYKCRNRSPWWRVPLSEKADAFVTYMNDYAPQICANFASVRHLNSVHGIVFADNNRDLGMRLLPLACINSASLLSSEVEGRSYGGGILKVEPREAARLLVPSPEFIAACSAQLQAIREKSQELLEANKLIEVQNLVDEVILDALPWLSAEALQEMRDEKQKLYQRRRTRGKKA